MKLLILLLLSIIFLNANLTKEQIAYLNSPLTQEKNDTIVIEQYYKIVFKKEIETPFDKKKHKFVIQKNLGTMKKGVMHKEQFVSLYSSATNELEQAIFAPLLQFGAIDHVETLLTKPKNYDVLIKLDVKKNGVDIIIKSKSNITKKSISFEKLFNIKF